MPPNKSLERTREEESAKPIRRCARRSAQPLGRGLCNSYKDFGIAFVAVRSLVAFGFGSGPTCGLGGGIRSHLGR